MWGEKNLLLSSSIIFFCSLLNKENDEFNSLDELNVILSEYFILPPYLYKIFFSKRYIKKFNYKINYVTEKKLNHLFKKNGFNVITVKKYSLGIPVLDKIFPIINYYIEVVFCKFFPTIGSEAIFLLKKK